jgi:hypothetical protein
VLNSFEEREHLQTQNPTSEHGYSTPTLTLRTLSCQQAQRDDITQIGP